LYCQNTFVFILRFSPLKYSFIILLEHTVEKSHNAAPFILSCTIFYSQEVTSPPHLITILLLVTNPRTNLISICSMLFQCCSNINVTSRSQDNFLCFKKRGFGISGVWKDVSDFSLAGQHVMVWATSRTHLSQVSDADQRTTWMLWRRLEQCVYWFFNCRSTSDLRTNLPVFKELILGQGTKSIWPGNRPRAISGQEEESEIFRFNYKKREQIFANI